MQHLAISAYEWLREWQPLLGGLLAVLASCIFAVSSIESARIRAGGRAKTRSQNIRNARPDLRSAASPGDGGRDEEHVDFIRDMEQLRSLVRSALSTLKPSESNAMQAIGANHRFYARIMDLKFQKSGLPNDASRSAHELVDLLTQHIEALGNFLRKKDSASDVFDTLIKINTASRNLVAALTYLSDVKRLSEMPPSLKQ